jgi:hypothetical protein
MREIISLETQGFFVTVFQYGTNKRGKVCFFLHLMTLYVGITQEVMGVGSQLRDARKEIIRATHNTATLVTLMINVICASH